MRPYNLNRRAERDVRAAAGMWEDKPLPVPPPANPFDRTVLEDSLAEFSLAVRGENAWVGFGDPDDRTPGLLELSWLLGLSWLFWTAAWWLYTGRHP